MLRRPPGEGRRSQQQQKILLAFAFILLPWLPLVDAQQQHRPAGEATLPDIQRVSGSSQQASDDAPAFNWAATPIEAAESSRETAKNLRRASTAKQRHQQRQQHQQQLLQQQQQKAHIINRKNQKHEYDNIIIPDDASALATLAPAQSVRALHPSRRQKASSVPASGLSSPQIARSLKDWEVEDFVLLATVDGDLYASDRKTGKERWHLEVDQPMVETTHHRANKSVHDDDFSPVDHYIWAVEPNRDGGLYVWAPDSDAGLVSTGFTMKKLVEELAPYADEDPPVVYTGDKKTTMITLDAASGRILKWFGSSGSHVNEAESCLRPNTFYDADNEECSSTGTITLGRTEYTVGIQTKDGHSIATLKYTEWTPNNFDNDLYQQHHASMDNWYIASKHDGRVYAFDYARSQTPAPRFGETFSAPVARVFDVCRPWDATPESNPDLVVLPQPPMPSHDETIAKMRSNSIFLNQTSSGSWYAMSGRAYPLIIDAPVAQISRSDWWDLEHPWDAISQDSISKALVGTHFLELLAGNTNQPATLPTGSMNNPNDGLDNESDSRIPAVVTDETTIISRFKSFPQNAANSAFDLITNPAFIVIFLIGLVTWHLSKNPQGSSAGELKRSRLLSEPIRELEELNRTTDASGKHSGTTADDADTKGRPISAGDPRVSEELSANPDEKAPDLAVVPKGLITPPNESPLTPKASVGARDVPSNNGIPELDLQVGPETPRARIPDTPSSISSPGEAAGRDIAAEAPPTEKKKKAHRGKRGGVKHRKKGGQGQSQSRNDDNPVTVNEAVDNAQQLGGDPRLKPEPDVETVTNDMGTVSGSVVRMGNIEVDTDEQLGTGSNGTLVFAGKFDGREVAVKRMLIQFYEIALQETNLLRESDDHPNVIRYYAQQVREPFLYIALERCAASLADVVEKAHFFRELAIAGQRDLPNVLYQITNGIRHLHGLRIVHRDLKPQNILVNMGKDGRPRLMVSDFGLCKKLEGGQSSFGATTGKAAGTSGWRAPELLLDDDARDSMTLDLSTHSGSGSVLVTDGLLPHNRRATRAIDIFSLGLVFFYVLTNGSHPFDCGDRYMREVNIRKGTYNLRPLDSLGDVAYEAKDLIGSMLEADPRSRPTAKEVLSHPFFWSAKKRLAFLCDVSDHFEKEPRDPPSDALFELESYAPEVTKGDFLRVLPRDFVDSLGKQRKYTGSRLLDLLRALRNKRNHYEDMPDSLKKSVGALPEGYLGFWAIRFPNLLLVCWNVVYQVNWSETDRFAEYYEPASH